MLVNQILLFFRKSEILKPLVRRVGGRPVPGSTTWKRHRDFTSHHRWIHNVTIKVRRLLQNFSNVLQRQRFPFPGPWIRSCDCSFPLDFQIDEVDLPRSHILRCQSQRLSDHVGLLVEIKNAPYRDTRTRANFSLSRLAHSHAHTARHSGITTVVPKTRVHPARHTRHPRHANHSARHPWWHCANAAFSWRAGIDRACGIAGKPAWQTTGASASPWRLRCEQVGESLLIRGHFFLRLICSLRNSVNFRLFVFLDHRESHEGRFR